MCWTSPVTLEKSCKFLGFVVEQSLAKNIGEKKKKLNYVLTMLKKSSEKGFPHLQALV